ncbi:MAG: hypothetical protein ACLTWK_12045 [Eisenbergiella sp.]
MEHIYGNFSNKQIYVNARLMHGDVHKLLLYKDPSVTDVIFEDDCSFLNFFKNLMIRFSGFNSLLGKPAYMISFLSTMQAAYDEACNPEFDFQKYRHLLLDVHGYIKRMFEGG